MPYDPEIWLESTVREIRDYVGEALNNFVRDSAQNPVGLYDPDTNADGPYQLIMEFPSPEAMRDMVPLPRVIVHFEIDDITDRIMGFGKNIHNFNYSATDKTVQPQEAGWHEINFDVGIWTSDKAGGTTARMRAYQILNSLFLGSLAQDALDAKADNGEGRIEITRYSGGRFLTETINDVVTYRSVEGVLEVRVFSRTPLVLSPIAPTIEEILQAPDFTIPD